MRETELFEPVKSYLEHHGYSVNAEVKDCDVTATKGDELVIVELKKNANMQLLIQATDRKHITDSVYVAIPHVDKNTKHWRGIQRVLRSLELGLLTVSMGPLGSRVTKLFDPLPYEKKKIKRRRLSVITEIANRSKEYNIGGSVGVKLVTAYRENAILIASCLELLGSSTPKHLRALGTGEKTTDILSNNHYNWFQRVERGVYSVTDQGIQDIRAYPELHQKSVTYIEGKQSEKKPV
jgi:hypothetical protein